MNKRTLNLPQLNSFFLLGPRQVGKSTLIRETFSADDVMFYDLLESDQYFRLQASPWLLRGEVQSRPSHKKRVVIDEIQRIPELLNEVHAMLESTPTPPQFILSGSSARKLKRLNANLLAGRAWTFYLFPFTAQEIGSEFSLMKALALGTLPSVYLSAEKSESKRTLRSYVDTYLREEIELEAAARSLSGFLRFLIVAADSEGMLLNFSHIGRDVGIASSTAQEYFRILEDTLIGTLLLPYHHSKRKRLSRQPKFYFFDTGVRRAILRILDLELTPGTYEFGRTFESWIINETRRILHYNEKEVDLFHYRSEHGAEIDLILESPGRMVAAIEIKSSSSPSLVDVDKGFTSFKELVPNSQCICICTAPNRREEGGVLFLPWQEYFDWLQRL